MINKISKFNLLNCFFQFIIVDNDFFGYGKVCIQGVYLFNKVKQ